jgi:hypothetical protein
VVEPLFLDRVAVEAGDRAQPAGYRGPRPAGGLHLAAEGLDVDPLGREQLQAMLDAPAGVLAQVQRVGVAGQAAVSGQETRQRLTLGDGEQRLRDRH